MTEITALMEEDDVSLPVPMLSGKLSREMLDNAATLSMPQIRGLVDSYYQVQEFRKAAASQQRAVDQQADSNPLVAWVLGRLVAIERDIQKIMDVATDYHVPSRWVKSHTSLGPTLAAGLLAHVDIARSPTPSALQRFAGFDPTQKWLGREKALAVIKEYLPGGLNDDDVEKLAIYLNRKPTKILEMATDRKTGKQSLTTLVTTLARRPWNAQLKVLLYKVGMSFVKFMNHPTAPIYSGLYRDRKAQEVAKNERGEFKSAAEAILAEKNYRRTTEAYKAYSVGKLPAGHLDARARRYAVKIFLVHFWTVSYEAHYGKPAPLPYIVAKDPAHTQLIPVPNWPLDE